MLLSPEIIRTLVFRIVKVFEDIPQIELSKRRWEEIKKLKISPCCVAEEPITRVLSL